MSKEKYLKNRVSSLYTKALLVTKKKASCRAKIKTAKVALNS